MTSFSLGIALSPFLLSVGSVLARVGPAVWMTPFLGGRLVPPMVKPGLLLLLAVILSPQLSSSALSLKDASPLILGAVLVKESLIGLALGFITTLIFWAAEAGGRLVDTLRGANFAEVLVPQLGIRSSPLGELFFQLTVILFLSLGGHRLFLMAIGTSYQVLPLHYFPVVSGVRAFTFYSIRLTADFFLVALTLTAPMLTAIFLSEVILGLVHRFVPQLNVFFLAMPVKAILGIAILAIVVGPLLSILPGLLDEVVAQLSRALELLGSGR